MEITERMQLNIVRVIEDASDPRDGLEKAAALLCCYDLADDETHVIRIRSKSHFARIFNARLPNLVERIDTILRRYTSDQLDSSL
jgi:hypothetical protein